MKEIEVPRDVREIMPEWVQETPLGHRDGARRQYRYGSLHIREYGDRFTVHTDRFDPRTSPGRHLLYDAPEVLAGVAMAGAGGFLAGRWVARRSGSPALGLAAGIAASLAAGYLAYRASRKLKGDP